MNSEGGGGQFFRLKNSIPDILKNAGIGMFIVEIDEGKRPRMYADEIMRNLLGIHEELSPEDTHQFWFEHVEKSNWDKVLKAIDKTIDGEHSEVQYFWNHPDNKQILIRCSGLRDYSYTAGVRVEGIFRNMTDMYSIEEKLKKQIEEHETLSDGLAREYHTVWLVDGFGEHRIHLYRSTGKKTVKSAVQRGLDEPLYDGTMVKYVMTSVHEDDRERVLEASKFETVARETPDVGTYVVTYKRYYNEQGDIDYHQMCFARAVAADGTVNYILAFRDADKVVREQITQNEKLKEQKILLDYFIESYSSAFSVDLINDTFEVLHMDPKIAEYFHVDGDRDDMIIFIETHIHPEDRDMMMGIIEPDYVSGKLKNRKSFNFTVREVFDDTIKTIRGIVVRGLDEYHVAIGFMDISDQLLEERERQNVLQNALELAESASKAKSAFLFNMSHDIRTPMNAITGFTEKAIRHQNDPEVLSEALEKVKASGNYLLRIINDILDMAKIESGQLELKDELHHTNNLENPLFDAFLEEAKKKDITLKIDYNVVDYYFWVDISRISQVVANLISNAIKYTQPGGTIVYKLEQIACDRPGYGRYVSTVSDNGKGMSKEFLTKIYDLFEREQSATMSGVEGTGLGMAIVKSIMDKMGGTIDIDSTPGKGTTVTITTEHRIATPEEIRSFLETQNCASAHSREILNGKRILVVEDNDMNREIAEDLLSEEGLVVETAEDGDIAVEKVRKLLDSKQYDYYSVILMDIQMPKMDGYEATRQIRRLCSADNVHIPIVAMTANAFDEDRHNAIQAGMDDHIPKPIDIIRVLDLLTKYME